MTGWRGVAWRMIVVALGASAVVSCAGPRPAESSTPPAAMAPAAVAGTQPAPDAQVMLPRPY